MKDLTGVVHGRFQLLHNDHIRYIMTGKERCDHLIIGICNPDMYSVKYSVENPHRSTKEANPFTYYERYQMIKGTLVDMGVEAESFDIIPFPINIPELIFNYSVRSANYYITIYDAWGRKKKEILESLGCRVEVLWDVSSENKGISATDVRRLISEKKEWKSYVPKYVYNFIIENHLDQRIRL